MRVLPVSLAVLALMAGSVAAQQFHPYGAPAAVSVPTYLTSTQPPRPVADVEEAVEPAPLGHGASVYSGASPSDVIHDGWCDCGPCDGGYAGGCDGGCCGPRFYASAGGLVMARDDCDPVWLSFDASIANNAQATLLGTPAADIDDYEGGWEATIGMHLGCGRAVELTYWGLEPVEASAGVADPSGMISSTLNFGNLNFSNADAVQNWFNNAEAHRVRLQSEFHNVELNLVGTACSWQSCRGGFNFGWLAGVRWFRFSDDFEFATSERDVVIDGDGDDDEAFYNIDIDNNLIGVQIGCRAEYRRCNWSVYAAPKIGIYVNHIENETSLTDGRGRVAFDIQNPGNRWDIDSDKDHFATLAQIDVGGEYCFCCNWTAYAGYRLLAASGVAHSTQQIPQYIADFSGAQAIDTNGSLFLHGAFGGVRYEW